MLKISFTNAEVSDHGYGLEVNGKSLEDIISTALGTTFCCRSTPQDGLCSLPFA